MEKQVVNSSIMDAVSYDASKAILEIEFTDGQVKQYLDVKQETYNELMAAASHGRYFLANIRRQHKSIIIEHSKQTR